MSLIIPLIGAEPTGRETAIVKWRESLAAKIAQARAQVLALPTGAAAYSLVDGRWRAATTMLEVAERDDMNELRRLESAVLELLEMRGALRTAWAGPLTNVQRTRIAEVLAGPITWLVDVGGPMLTSAAWKLDTAEALRDAVTNAPKNFFKWSLDQLGLPSWALPAGLVVVGLVVAAPYVTPLLYAARRRTA